MSKAIGCIFDAGSIYNDDDEEKKRRAENQALLDEYIKTAEPIDAENYLNTADGYMNLNRLKELNSHYIQSDLAISNLNSAPDNNIQYAELNNSNLESDAEQKYDYVDYSLYGDDFQKEDIDKMLQDQDYQQALDEYAIPNEGGYVYNPNDPGGETNMGIAKRYHPNEDIKNLTRERANAILYNEVWNWNGINNLPSEIRGFVFDHGIRTSPQNAIKTVHEVLDIPPGGTIIGNTTLDRLEEIDYEEFLRRYQNAVRRQDRKNANYKHFGTGWDNRTNRYHVSRTRRKRI
jgi:hypothetical protein